jgi:hypothetical protein
MQLCMRSTAGNASAAMPEVPTVGEFLPGFEASQWYGVGAPRSTPAEVIDIVHSAGVQDRDGGIWLLATLFGQFPFLAKLFADSAYAGSIFHTALGKVLPNLKN